MSINLKRFISYFEISLNYFQEMGDYFYNNKNNIINGEKYQIETLIKIMKEENEFINNLEMILYLFSQFFKKEEFEEKYKKFKNDNENINFFGLSKIDNFLEKIKLMDKHKDSYYCACEREIMKSLSLLMNENIEEPNKDKEVKNIEERLHTLAFYKFKIINRFFRRLNYLELDTNLKTKIIDYFKTGAYFEEGDRGFQEEFDYHIGKFYNKYQIIHNG